VARQGSKRCIWQLGGKRGLGFSCNLSERGGENLKQSNRACHSTHRQGGSRSPKRTHVHRGEGQQQKKIKESEPGPERYMGVIDFWQTQEKKKLGQAFFYGQKKPPRWVGEGANSLKWYFFLRKLARRGGEVLFPDRKSEGPGKVTPRVGGKRI